MIEPAERSLKLLIADGHPMCLRGVRSIMHNVSGYEIVQEASSGQEALRLILECRPDMAILDSGMHGMQGFAAVRRIQMDVPDTRIVIFSSHEDRNYVREALAVGARGYVLKRSDPECLLQALNAVRGGGLYLDPNIASYFVVENASDGRRNGLRPDRSAMPLTDREREVFRLIALGFTNKEVAGKLGVTAKSIETYKNRASEKLNIRSRAKIVQYAMLQGWFEAPYESSARSEAARR